MVFDVRLGLRRFAPFSLPPRAIIDQSHSSSCACRTAFFERHRPLQEQALDGPLPHEKSAQLSLSAFALVVIRLGFEPKTHSLEGCCSIQLSYRTDPYFFWRFCVKDAFSSKVAAKICYFFENCNICFA